MTIFYQNRIQEGVKTLSEEESKHCAQVLRHQKGDEILIFDGNGGQHRAVLTNVSKKTCDFEVIKSEFASKKPFRTHLAIAPTKNADRMEWLVEKLSEIGVDEVTFIQTKHSERKKMRLDRLHKKALSAMKQSGNPFLLHLNELCTLSNFLDECDSDTKLIAHVDKSHQHISNAVKPEQSVAILIGPEGDFSKEEVEMAKKNGFAAISLGKNTLRTETAGLIACCCINTVNKY